MMMRPQELNEMGRGVAVPGAMAHDDDPAGPFEGAGDFLAEALILVRPLSALPRLILVRKVVKEMVRIVGLDCVFGGVPGRDVETKNARFVVVHDDQKVRRATMFEMGGRRGRRAAALQ